MIDAKQFLSDPDMIDVRRFELKWDIPNAVNACQRALLRHAGLAEDEPQPQQIELKRPLVRLGEKYKPSKRDHNYLKWYDHVFGAIRKDVRHVVEIGVQTDRSIKMWRDYFPNALITGIDIDPDCKAFEGNRIQIKIGNQLDLSFLKEFVRECAVRPDIVIDDGLHTEQAIARSFFVLYPRLSPHGIYAIEDIIRLKRIYRFLQQAVSAINYWPPCYPGEMWQVLRTFPEQAGWFASNTIGLEVYRHIAFVKRGWNPGGNPHIRDAEEVFGYWNKALADIKRDATKLAANGQPVTYDGLVASAGFQRRHYVKWFLGGVEEVSSETSFAPLMEARSGTVAVAPDADEMDYPELLSRLESAQSAARELAAQLEAARAEARDLAVKLETSDAERHDLAARVERGAAEAEELRTRIEATESRAETLEESLAARDAQLDQLRSSTSWRLTAPMRRIGRASPLLARSGRWTLRLAWRTAAGLLRPFVSSRR